MKRILYFGFAFISLLIITGCGSGTGNKAEGPTDSQSTHPKISPEVALVLKLVTGQSTQSKEADEEENQLQKLLKRSITDTSSILYRHSEQSFANPVPKDMASCQYEGRESYIPEIVDANTMRETFIYDWCKKDHPIASHLIERHNGLYIREETDPDYTGSDPLRDPYFMTRELIHRMKDYTGEEYDKSTGVLLTHTYYPDYYYRTTWKFDKIPGIEPRPWSSPYYMSENNIWVSGTARDVFTNGTTYNPDDDYIYESVYDNYSSEDTHSDYHYKVWCSEKGICDSSAYSGLDKGTENGYKKVSWEDRKAEKKYSFGALYENYSTETYRLDLDDNGKLDETDASYYSIDGAITPDTCSGEKFVIKTLLSLYKPYKSPCPLDGELEVTRGESKVTFRFKDNQTVEVDIGSDGVRDEIVSCQLVVDSDFCM